MIDVNTFPGMTDSEVFDNAFASKEHRRIQKQLRYLQV